MEILLSRQNEIAEETLLHPMFPFSGRGHSDDYVARCRKFILYTRIAIEGFGALLSFSERTDFNLQTL
jgi:hypothetical protein